MPVIRSHRRLGAAMTLTGGVAVASLAFASLPLTTGAAAPAATSTRASVGSVTAAAAAASYLVRQLQGPHHNHYSYTFDGKSYPNYGQTIDAALSMDAAAVAQSAVKRMTNYLERNVSQYAGTKPSGQFTGYSPGAIGKLLLLAEAQHANVHNFGGAHLVAEVKSTEGVRGAKRGEYQQNLVGTPSDEDFTATASQALAMLGLAGSAKSNAQPDHAARHFLKAQQCANGGFPSELLANPKKACQAGSDIDSTGYAVQALLASGNRAAAMKGIRYLRRVQNHNGGFGARRRQRELHRARHPGTGRGEAAAPQRGPVARQAADRVPGPGGTSGRGELPAGVQRCVEPAGHQPGGGSAGQGAAGNDQSRAARRQPLPRSTANPGGGGGRAWPR